MTVINSFTIKMYFLLFISMQHDCFVLQDVLWNLSWFNGSGNREHAVSQSAECKDGSDPAGFHPSSLLNFSSSSDYWLTLSTHTAPARVTNTPREFRQAMRECVCVCLSKCSCGEFKAPYPSRVYVRHLMYQTAPLFTRAK